MSLGREATGRSSSSLRRSGAKAAAVVGAVEGAAIVVDHAREGEHADDETDRKRTAEEGDEGAHRPRHESAGL